MIAQTKMHLRERRQGLGILVSKIPKETNALYSLQEPDEKEMEYSTTQNLGGKMASERLDL
ncbi:hypothetical protein YC2023_088340 [Brassica napus]